MVRDDLERPPEGRIGEVAPVLLSILGWLAMLPAYSWAVDEFDSVPVGIAVMLFVLMCPGCLIVLRESMRVVARSELRPEK